eukprot:15358836-Ditylum_brightwellii.AAC.2
MDMDLSLQWKIVEEAVGAIKIELNKHNIGGIHHHIPDGSFRVYPNKAIDPINFLEGRNAEVDPYEERRYIFKPYPLCNRVENSKVYFVTENFPG